MNKKQILDEILGILFYVKEDKEKLEIIHSFLMDGIEIRGMEKLQRYRTARFTHIL